MQTLDLDGAAGWLKCDPETVRSKAASGELPGAKIGRAWVFFEEDLVEYVRSKYVKNQSCRSTKTQPSQSIGTPRSRSKASQGLDEALALPTRRKQSEYMMNGEQKRGEIVQLEAARTGTTQQSHG
jgi:hypothetical protein